MKHTELSALRRQNTIYELIESMRAAQRSARISESKILRRARGAEKQGAARVLRVPGRVGIWKGGC